MALMEFRLAIIDPLRIIRIIVHQLSVILAILTVENNGCFCVFRVFTCATAQCNARFQLRNGEWRVMKDYNHAADEHLEEKDTVLRQIYRDCLYRLLNLTSIIVMHTFL